MGTVRRTISFVLAVALTIAGFGILVYLLLFGGRGWMIVGSGFSGTLGAYWLYEDLNPPAEKKSES